VIHPRPQSGRIVLGESNRFHADGAAAADDFHDDMLVTLSADVGALGVYGVSDEAFCSSIQACHSALSAIRGHIGTAILARGRMAEALSSSVAEARFFEAPDDFLSAVKEAKEGGTPVLAIVAEPYLWPELSQSNLGRNGAKVEELLSLVDDEQVFVVVCAPDIKRMKTQAGWHDDAIPIRILSVGNPALLRQMVSTDVAEKIKEGSFNIARSDVTKAYYYNKTTGKFGRMRMFPVTTTRMEPALANPPSPFATPAPSDDTSDGEGWAGLSGN
jgi:hypothetical protein